MTDFGRSGQGGLTLKQKCNTKHQPRKSGAILFYFLIFFMKKIFRSVSVAGLVIFSLLLGAALTSITSAQEGESALVQKIDALVDQLAAIAASNAEVTDNQKSDGSPELQQTFFGSSMGNPSCLDAYETFPNSNMRDDDSPWAAHSLPVGLHHTNGGDYLQPWLDLNGDGLVDYLYHSSKRGTANGYLYDEGVQLPGTSYNETGTCLYLNNGSGWDLAYKCYARREATGAQYTYEMKYYGDCADI